MKNLETNETATQARENEEMITRTYTDCEENVYTWEELKNPPVVKKSLEDMIFRMEGYEQEMLAAKKKNQKFYLEDLNRMKAEITLRQKEELI